MNVLWQWYKVDWPLADWSAKMWYDWLLASWAVRLLADKWINLMKKKLGAGCFVVLRNTIISLPAQWKPSPSYPGEQKHVFTGEVSGPLSSPLAPHQLFSVSFDDPSFTSQSRIFIKKKDLPSKGEKREGRAWVRSLYDRNWLYLSGKFGV